ncbi:MAG TPA: hypothetical protein VHD31_03890 [Candidatus Paceibacterota bacterium]|nr:hypothetical protein [Candidatus Paceibacterota bacterium]
MDWHAWVGVTAGILQVGSIVPYIWGMLHGTTRPNIVSWGLWTVLQGISVAALWSAGASWPILILIAATFNTLLVLVLCLFGYGYKKYDLTDTICLVLAVVAILLWYITSQPLLALILAIAADFCATVPTIIKAWKDPHSEAVWSWFIVIFASGLSLVATTRFDASNLIWPIYIVIACGFITGLVFWGQIQHPKKGLK